MARQTKTVDDQFAVEGKTITLIRTMTPEELTEEGWLARGYAPPVLILDNGLKLFASCDDEGNGPGALFGKTKRGDGFRIPPRPTTH